MGIGRKRAAKKRGQALVLACLVMFVLCLAVLATLNLGHNVTERVRLQNTADAAAHSIAAMEARAFNFYAFANRTQVSHYVSAMVWQSYLSFIYFSEAFLTDVYGVMKTLDGCAGARSGFWAAACPVLEAIPYVGPVIRALNVVIQLYRGVVYSYQMLLRAMDPDSVIGRKIIPAHRALNQALAIASEAVMLSALSQAAQTAKPIIEENDRNVDLTFSQSVGGAMSACLFDRAHFREANGSPLSPADPFKPIQPSAVEERSRHSRAKRTMGGIANGTRFACDSAGGPCPRGFVTSRKLSELLPLPGGLGPLRDLIDRTPKWGQTRFLSYGLAKGFDHPDGGNLIRHWKDPPGAPQAMLAQGDNLGADDLYSIKLGPARLGLFRNPFACDRNAKYWECWGDPRHGLGDDRTLPFRYMMKTSVWAMNDSEPKGKGGGVHWRVSYPDWPSGRGQVNPAGPEAPMGLHRTQVCVAKGGCIAGFGALVDVFTANVRPIQDGNHPWAGIVPFMHFEPGEYADSCPALKPASLAKAASRKQDFNQPSAWVVLNKGPRQIRNPGNATAGTHSPALLNERGTASFGLSAHSILQMENIHSSWPGWPAGLNAIARAQTYYHRPGNWAEQPNFFNPYWRPRLASIYQARESVPLVQELLRRLPGNANRSAQRFVLH
jgi:hypothetical protein